MPSLALDLGRLPKPPLQNSESGRHGLLPPGDFDGLDMDHLERISDTLTEVVQRLSGVETRVEGFTNLITHTVAHDIETMKSAANKRGERIGKLEQDLAVKDEKIRQLSAVVMKGGGTVLLSVVAALVLMFVKGAG